MTQNQKRAGKIKSKSQQNKASRAHKTNIDETSHNVYFATRLSGK